MRVLVSLRRRVPFDWAGQVAAIVAMAALTYGLIEGGAAGFGAPQVVAALALAVAAILAILVTESRAADPVSNADEIREFMTTRRSRITPDRAGLPHYGCTRRVPGLRREEVALLAVSATSTTPSSSVATPEACRRMCSTG